MGRESRRQLSVAPTHPKLKPDVMLQTRSKTLVVLLVTGLFLIVARPRAFSSEPAQLRHVITKQQALTRSACSVSDHPDCAAAPAAITAEKPSTVVTAIMLPAIPSHNYFDESSHHVRPPPSF